MFSSLFQPAQARPAEGEEDEAGDTPTPGPSHRVYPEPRHATADFTEPDDDDDDSNQEGFGGRRDQADVEDEDGRRRSTPVLPLFSASYLGQPPPSDVPTLRGEPC